MAKQYTISQLAKAADVATTTLRYYERVGLIVPEDRSRGNYRLYTDESLRRLRFVRTAQATGFTLDDIKTLLGIESDAPAGCNEVQTLIETRLAEVQQKLRDLRQVQRVLATSLTKCREMRNPASCPVIDTLNETSP